MSFVVGWTNSCLFFNETHDSSVHPEAQRTKIRALKILIPDRIIKFKKLREKIEETNNENPKTNETNT